MHYPFWKKKEKTRNMQGESNLKAMLLYSHQHHICLIYFKIYLVRLYVDRLFIITKCFFSHNIVQGPLELEYIVLYFIACKSLLMNFAAEDTETQLSGRKSIKKKKLQKK